MTSDQSDRPGEPGRSGTHDGPVRQEPAAGPEAFAARLATLPAGDALLSVLESLDLDALDAFERVEAVAAAGRVEALAHALKARAAWAVDRHPDMRPTVSRLPEGTALVAEHATAATLAPRLQVTEAEARLLVREGRAYAGVLAATGAALADGRIDAPRARAFVRRVADEPAPVAAAVEEQVLPAAPGRTVGQVRVDLEKALYRVDGAHAADRHQAARACRSVGRPRVLHDGMAGTWVVLPAVQALQVDAALDAVARSAKAAGDPRTLHQLRADELVDRVAGPGTAAPPRDGVPVPSLHGAGVEDLSAFGVPAGTDAVPAVPAPGTARTDGTKGSVPDGPPGRPNPPRTHVYVTVPLTTLMGLDDEPGELSGHGPVDAAQARTLALHLGATWQRIVTDPLSGTVHDVGRTTYRPPAALADHVRHRDKYCAAPGCPVPAARCDLDHTVAFDPPTDRSSPRPPGTTSADNLGPLCRHHHRLKTAGVLGVRQPTAGEYVWTTPSGHRFRVRPGSDEPTAHLTAAPPAGPPPPF